MSVIYEFSWKARVFVPERLYQPLLSNALALCKNLKLWKKKFYNFAPWCQCYKTFLVRNSLMIKISWSVCCQAFKPSLMFVGKVGAQPIEGPLRCSTLGQAPDLAHKQQTSQLQTLQLNTKIHKLRTKKFNNIDLWCECYKTFHVCNFLMFVISQSVCTGRPFQLSLMFVGKARSLGYSGAPERYFTWVGSSLFKNFRPKPSSFKYSS